MTDVGVETVEVASTNGGADPLGLEPKATVLAREDSVSGRLALKGPGQVLGNFSGQIDCDGDLLVGPEAHVEADIHAAVDATESALADQLVDAVSAAERRAESGPIIRIVDWPGA